ncbi:MAG TPA: glutathione S-transferase family protein [Reyranella sp.]|nr:glutathione S-transferase family protein [Reyranella sp.]
MADVVLHGFHRSTYVSIAKLVLTAKGVPFLFHDTEQAMGTTNGWTLHPFDRVPVLTHDGFTVFETAAIAAYVDEAFFGPALSPAGPRERARMNRWISSVNSYYYPWIVYHLVHERVVFGELGIAADEAVVAASLPHIDRGLEVLEKVLGSGTAFLAGDRVSLADYFMLPSLVALGMADEGRAALSRAPAVLAWIARMAVLPAVVSVGAGMPPRQPIEHARRWATEHRPAVRAI